MRFVFSEMGMIPFVSDAIEHAKDEVVKQIKESLLTWGLALLEIIKDGSFSIALIGGGVCFLVYFLTGIRRAGKASGLLVLIYTLIQFLLS